MKLIIDPVFAVYTANFLKHKEINNTIKKHKEVYSWVWKSLLK